MPRTCTVCAHEKLEEINAALIVSEPLRKISENTGTSITALHRHKAEHLPVALQKAEEAREIVASGTLLEQVRSLHTRTLAILERAEAAGALETALKAIREARNNLELLARMDGELKDHGGKMTVNVVYVDRQLAPANRQNSPEIEAGKPQPVVLDV